MSESVACALEYLNNDKTQQTRLFIRMIDRFFDCMNVKSFKLSEFKRKESIAPYTKPNDERFKVCNVHVCSCTCATAQFESNDIYLSLLFTLETYNFVFAVAC